MLNAILSIFTNRLTWNFFGITIISSIIWFIGPFISIGNTVPFKSSAVRIITILFLYLVWLFILSIFLLYQTWRNKKLSTQKAPNQLNENDDESKQSKYSQYTALSEHFSEALRLLKNAYFYSLDTQSKSNKYKPSSYKSTNSYKSNSYKSSRYKSIWRAFFSRRYLYQLPWYVIIGAPNSGKTTMLANSGLPFPLAEHLGNLTAYNMKETDNCNWWFTNNAVLLDTTGRYTTQDTLYEQDAGEWKYFISLLKKYRTRQPLNGVILTVSVEDLLNPSQKERDQQAYLLRRRLAELHEQFKIQFPIYVIITKIDLLKGFSAYFSHFDKAQRDQIWGFNFPWDKTDWSLNEVFEQQYNLLQKRLDAELPDVLLQLNDPQHCAESYLFPQEFATLRSLIAQYLEIAFAQSRFDIPYLLRGLYFTSGTQEGTPFDRVMEKLNHNLQLPTDNDNHSLSWRNNQVCGNNKNSPEHPSISQAYFLKNLLGNISQEAGFASQNRWWVYRSRLLNGLGYTALAALLGLMVIYFFISYNDNKNYLIKIQNNIQTISDSPLDSGGAFKNNVNNYYSDIYYSDIYAGLPILNLLENLVIPLPDQIVLPYSKQVHDACISLYYKALQKLLLPQVEQAIISQIQQDNGNDLSNTYNTLKAYQELHSTENNKSKYDGNFLYNWMILYLQKHSPLNIQKEQSEQIKKHLYQLFQYSVVKSPYIYQQQRVEEKQKLFSSISLAQLYYTLLKKELSDDPNLPSIYLADLIVNDNEHSLSLTGVTSGYQYISGIFTPIGYKKLKGILDKKISRLNDEEDRVLGRYAKKHPPKDIAISVLDLYANDYIKSWDDFLFRIHFNKEGNHNFNELNHRIKLLNSNNSPMRNLAINIAKNVNIEENKNDVISGKIRDFFNLKVNSFIKTSPNQLTPEDAKIALEQKLKKYFSPYIELTKVSDEKNNKIVFDSILDQFFNKFREYAVKSMQQEEKPNALDQSFIQLQNKVKELPTPFNHILSELLKAATGDIQHSNFENLSNQLDTEVGVFCKQAIANRYPLTHEAHNDIKLTDMSRMFAPQVGNMDSFFRKNLAGKVNISQKNWHFIPREIDEEILPESTSFLKPFQQAKIIQDTLFSSGSTTPSFHVSVRPIKMDNNILSMELNVYGQILKYSHGPQISQSFKWPGPDNTNNVYIQLDLADGTTAKVNTYGPWALNRLIDEYTDPKLNSSSRNNATQKIRLNIHGHFVSLDVTSDSTYSPFQLPNFICPSLKTYNKQAAY
ncbi:type VI secretion system membrane subunit TssM [Xenorhabdus anantnagensis]|uniref:Type VI secretion system membrane subunit TssM n=1 Tax=Xenorhabdus anantnagensis TaxID=3025875 RepID=A0ABT5LLY7_9GAMM|nr:type VI secretion system membrane subunit TssM [Xenorhabdus anantnagensis]MDC9595426.1 type VI secretion system membrane subunit TssM [Xenorhabdus anantnagensis]